MSKNPLNKGLFPKQDLHYQNMNKVCIGVNTYIIIRYNNCYILL